MASPRQGHNSLNMTKVEEEEEKLISQKAKEIARGMELQMAMKSAIELGILDTISEANDRGVYLSASEVVAKIPGCVNPNAPVFVECILSLLASFSVLRFEFRSKNGEEDGGVSVKAYGLEPVCKYFLTNKVDGSMAPLLCMRYDKICFGVWDHMTEAIREGGTAFEKSQGMKLFEYMSKDSRLSKLFNDAMSDYTIIVMKKILDIYQGLDEINVLVDVGGGIGSTLKLIISKYPNIKGINFDLPHVVADGPAINPEVEHIGGDMLKEVPNADAVILKWILHSWNEEQCVKLLKNCWKALPKKGKVIVLEELLPLKPENNIESQLTLATSLAMYANFGALERTIEDYKALAIKSGFFDCLPICCAHNNWILEFHKD